MAAVALLDWSPCWRKGFTRYVLSSITEHLKTLGEKCSYKVRVAQNGAAISAQVQESGHRVCGRVPSARVCGAVCGALSGPPLSALELEKPQDTCCVHFLGN